MSALVPAAIALAAMLSLPVPIATGAQTRPASPTKAPPPSTVQAKLVAILEREREAIEALRPRITALQAELEALRREYDGAWIPPRRSLERREPLRRELEQLRAKVRDHVEIFRGHLNEYENLSFANAFIRFRIEGKGAEKLAEKVADVDPARKYSRSVDPLDRGVQQTLGEEQAAFERALARRRRRIGVCASGGLLSAALLVALFLKLRSSRREGDTDRPRGGVLVFAGRFRLDRILGKNPLGTFHEGVDLGNGSPARIWVLDPSSGASESRVRSIAQAARKAAVVQESSFQRMLLVLQEGNRLGLILEAPRGRPVREILGAGARASLASTMDLLERAASALEVLHSKGLSHGSLCPANLHLSPDGSLQIAALGLPCGGDPAYQAPEHPCSICPSNPLFPSEAGGRIPGIGSSCGADKPYGPPGKAVDVYGLAATAFSLLTGRTPFPGPDVVEQKRRLALPPPPDGSPSLPARLDAALRKGLAPDPARRFSTCRELLAALRTASKPAERDSRGR